MADDNKKDGPFSKDRRILTSAGLVKIGIDLIGVSGKRAAERARAKYNESIADFKANQMAFNTQLIDFELRDLTRRTDKAIRNYEKEINKVLGQQKVRQAKRGISLDSDVAIDYEAETRENGALDIETIRSNAWKKAFALKSTKLDRENAERFMRITGKTQAKIDMANADISFMAGVVGAVADGIELFGEELFGKGETLDDILEKAHEDRKKTKKAREKAVKERQRYEKERKKLIKRRIEKRGKEISKQIGSLNTDIKLPKGSILLGGN